MPQTTQHIAAYACLCGVLLGLSACSPKHIPAMTVSDLMEDRVTLDGVLLKCNQNPAQARNSTDCLNARIAVERLAKDVDPADEAKRTADFERSREQLRLSQEKVRRELEAKNKLDGYDLPLVPVETPATPAASPPGLAQTKP